MTSAESTLLGVAIGAALSWAGSTLQSRWQWRREERLRLADRRAELYQSMMVETDRLTRSQKRAHDVGIRDPTIRDEEGWIRKAQYEAFVTLFGSQEVHTLWKAWIDVFSENWTATPLAYGEPWQTRHDAALDALKEQMRAEVATL